MHPARPQQVGQRVRLHQRIVHSGQQAILQGSPDVPTVPKPVHCGENSGNRKPAPRRDQSSPVPSSGA